MYDVGWDGSLWDVDNAFGIDMGEDKEVDTIRIYMNPGTTPHVASGGYNCWDPDENGTLSAYYSSDNSSWTLIDFKDCNDSNFPLRQYNVEGVASFDFIFSSAITARYFKLVNTGSNELKFLQSNTYLSFSARCAGEIKSGYRIAPESIASVDEDSTVKWDTGFSTNQITFSPKNEYKTVVTEDK